MLLMRCRCVSVIELDVVVQCRSGVTKSRGGGVRLDCQVRERGRRDCRVAGLSMHVQNNMQLGHEWFRTMGFD